MATTQHKIFLRANHYICVIFPALMYYCILDHHVMLNLCPWSKLQHNTHVCAFSTNNYFVSRRVPRNRSGRTRQKAESLAIGWAIKEVINKGTEVRMFPHNFGIPETILSHHLLKFKKQESHTDFECTARNDDKKVFFATWGLELVDSFKQVAKLHFGVLQRRKFWYLGFMWQKFIP